ncbi:uncharacterized protein (DUF1810 family) [Variovorax sp. 54]|uniref:DUF1810 domain-containing protein n=1 Tax=Variovorax sp. 54 TaxID=2035212 RepID=UPI000C1765E9|nr:DUF1810 domain-containing protein [Variovorax sp. 54]PIF76446.1 uncharacterized protein (DUF1810 family) [Variovorax sp. 54]
MTIDWHLERFVTAQDPVYAQVCAELTAGRKRTHWMWFVFPQLKALGRSATAQFFGLDGAAEATAYWQHPVLGKRLHHCAELVRDLPAGTDIHQVFGAPDDLKLRSCMTLFEIAVPEASVFGDVLARYFDGARDDATIALVSH